MQRTNLTLNGFWDFRTDPEGQGDAQGWAAGVPGGRPVRVPGSWQLYSHDLLAYTGTAWFQRRVYVPVEWTGRAVFLQFGAVDYHAVVYVNGQFAGEHVGGYLPFEVDVTTLMRPGTENLVVVRVTDPADLSEIPHGKQGGRWYTPVSGIWQDVALEVRSPQHITDVKVFPDHTGRVRFVIRWVGGADRVQVEVGRPYRYRVVAEVEAVAHGPAGLCFAPTPAGQPASVVREEGSGGGVVVMATGGDASSVELTVPDPHPWSPEEPWLYTATVTLFRRDAPVDQVQVEFGLRTITHSGGQFYLNGRLIHLRGALDQAYWPHTLYAPPSEEAIVHEIIMARGIGLNLLRKHIKPEVPAYLRWADRLGMLIWAEVANPLRYTETAKRNLATELAAMVDRDFNHPSIIIWSIYNEEWGVEFRLEQDEDKQEWVRELYVQLKAQDPTRLICDNSGWTHVHTDINDYHRYFASPERGREWEADLNQIIREPAANWVTAARDNAQGQPIVMSEWGVWGLPDIREVQASYGGTPYWYRRDWVPLRDFKNPSDVLDKFEQLGLGRFFRDFGVLAASSQRRQWRGVKHQVEEMRRRPQIAGYVVTELQDIEWEANGWLDYLRRPKDFYHELRMVNGALAVLPRVEVQNLWSGDELVCSLNLLNDTPVAAEGPLHYSLTVGGQAVATGTLSCAAPASGRCDLSVPIRLKVPLVAGSQSARLDLRWETGAGVAENYVELTVTGSLPAPEVAIEPYKVDPELVQRLVENGFTVGSDSSAVIVTQEFDRWVSLQVKGIRKVLYLADDGRMTGRGQPTFTFRRLPPWESWDMASSMFFIDTARFPGLPLHPEMGWETAPLSPDYVITDLDPADYPRVIGGYFQGWLGRYGATILEREVGLGLGRVLATTLKFTSAYGRDPIATAMLHVLINSLK